MPLTDTRDGISDKILEQADVYIKALLMSKTLKPEARAQLEIQSYFLMFLAADHEKVSKMYPFYKQQEEKQTRWEESWHKFQWIVIPIAITYLIGFSVNAIETIFLLYQKFSP